MTAVQARLGALISQHWRTLKSEPCPIGHYVDAYAYCEAIALPYRGARKQAAAARWLEDHGGSLRGFKP